METETLVHKEENKERSTHVAINLEGPISLMKQNLSFYKGENSNSNSRLTCIYKVPKGFHTENEDAYTPRVVSIGPLHHGKPNLQAMELYKWRCLHRYLERSSLELEFVVGVISSYEHSVRLHYQDRFENIRSQEFLLIILLDCIFVIEFVLENGLEILFASAQRRMKIIDDPWTERDILHDIMLLENQIPYVVFIDLFRRCVANGLSDEVVHNYMLKYFNNTGLLEKYQPMQHDQVPTHLVDFLRKCHRPSTKKEDSQIRGKFEWSRSAIELDQEGICFILFIRKGSGTLLDIEFSTAGSLKIPQLTVNEWSDTFFRNLIAYERCKPHEVQYITSYVTLMRSLLHTPKDVDLLVLCGIIKNLLGDNEKVWTLFSSITRNIEIGNEDFYFARLFEKLNAHSRIKNRGWIERMKRARLFKQSMVTRFC